MVSVFTDVRGFGHWTDKDKGLFHVDPISPLNIYNVGSKYFHATQHGSGKVWDNIIPDYDAQIVITVKVQS